MEMTGKFHIKENQYGWRWYLTASNGQVIAQSYGHYANKPAVLNGIESVRKWIPGAEIQEP